MTQGETPNLRYPLLGRDEKGRIRFRRSIFVLDARGVGLECRGLRNGLAWDDIAGYEWRDFGWGRKLRLTAQDGHSIDLPLPAAAEWDRSLICLTLDQHLTLQGLPTMLAIPSHEIALRLAQHRGFPPAVEMEPNVRYRYANGDLLKLYIGARRWWMFPLVVPIPFVLTITKQLTGSLGTGLAVAALYGLLIGAILFPFLLTDARLIRHLKDRFVLRDGVLYVIRNETEKALPPGRESSRRLLKQRFRKHGSGLFAYQMAPQFLEPDVNHSNEI